MSNEHTNTRVDYRQWPLRKMSYISSLLTNIAVSKHYVSVKYEWLLSYLLVLNHPSFRVLTVICDYGWNS